jgi:hypothetical protein
MKSRKPPQFAKRKLSFDSVLAAYRQAKDVNGGMGAVSIGGGGKGTANPVRPSLTDFRCDVVKVLNKVLKTEEARKQFAIAYLEYDSDDPIEMEVHAEKIMGQGRHGLEQGIGNLFLAKGLFPLHGHGGYFTCVRQPRGSV